jgi:plastocyanin
MKFRIIIAFLAIVTASVAVAADQPSVEIVIKNHKFIPAEVVVPAGQKVKLIVINQDATPEEFESYELNREKIIPGGKQAVIYIGPLKPGQYPFFGEFHEDSAKGTIIAK